MNILLLASAVSPYKGSEYSVAWNYLKYMSHQHKLFVVYRGDEDDINKFLDSYNQDSTDCINLENIKFYHVPDPDTLGNRIISKLWSKGFNPQNLWVYYYHTWHKEAYKKALKIMQAEKIEVIHYLNSIGFKEAGLLWKINSVPYIWGPTSAVHIPKLCLWRVRGIKGAIDSFVRIIFLNRYLLLDKNLRSALKRADFLYAATPETKREFKKWHNIDAFYLPENGMTTLPDLHKSYNKGETLKLIWIGSINLRKALTITLDALHLISNENWTLDVYGDGPFRLKMEEKAVEYGIAEKITFHGNVPRKKAEEAMRCANLHIISSTLEATTTVLWEAMEHGVPTMTLDHCGMAGVVCEKCGIKIPLHSYKQITHDMAANIKAIIDNPDKLNALYKGVVECSKKFTWEKRVQIFNEGYRKAIEHFNKTHKS